MGEYNGMPNKSAKKFNRSYLLYSGLALLTLSIGININQKSVKADDDPTASQLVNSEDGNVTNSNTTSSAVLSNVNSDTSAVDTKASMAGTGSTSANTSETVAVTKNDGTSAADATTSATSLSSSTSISTVSTGVKTDTSTLSEQKTDLGNATNDELTMAKAAAAEVYKATGQAQKITVVAASSTTSQDAFLASIKQGALDGWTKYGVLPSITAAQAIIESGWGKSALTTEGNNLFGIKGSYNGQSITFPTGEYYGGHYVTVEAAFRRYANYAQSIDDHGQFLAYNSRYSNLLWDTSYTSVANKLHSDGYATAPTYAATLINTINAYHLYEWDQLVLHHYNTITQSQYADYYATITESNGRNDGVFSGGAYNTNSSSINSIESGTSLVNNRVHVTMEQTLDNGATYVQFDLNGQTLWIDKAALNIEYSQVSNYKIVDYVGVISQIGRSDGIYYGGPYKTSYTSMGCNSNAGYFNGQQVHVVGTENVGAAVYYQFEYGGLYYWMDAAGFELENYYTPYNYKSADYDAVLTQTVRHDGIYYGGPYFTSGQSYYSNDHGQYFNGDAVHVVAEETVNGANYIQFEYGGLYYWIDKAGIQKVTPVSYTYKNVDYNVVLNQSSRYDGIYSGTPFNGELSTMTSNNNGQYYDGLTAHVVKEAYGDNGAVYVQFEYMGQYYWIDKAGTSVTPRSYSIINADYNAVLNQSVRHDGIYYGGPFGATIGTSVVNDHGKYFNGLKIIVVAEAKFNNAVYVEFQFGNQFYWIDKNALA